MSEPDAARVLPTTTEGEDSLTPARERELSIKKRIVRAKRIRKPEEDDTLSSPGAGPSSPRKTRRSQSPIRQPQTQPQPQDQAQHSDLPAARRRSQTPPPPGPKPLAPPPKCLYAPTRRSHPPLTSCRSVYNYTRLNHIEEGTYGVVFRAKCNETGEIYALKKLKLEEEKQGFPITSLREVMALMIGGRHENVVGIKEIVVGDTLNQ